LFRVFCVLSQITTWARYAEIAELVQTATRQRLNVVNVELVLAIGSAPMAGLVLREHPFASFCAGYADFKFSATASAIAPLPVADTLGVPLSPNPLILCGC
jgi:hypothetical protein